MRRQYSNALRSLCATPSPSAYMRPSSHWASAGPFAGAYSSEFTALTVSPALSQFAPERKASIGDIGGGPTLGSVLLPSRACAGAAARRPPISSARNVPSNVRIALFLTRPARMRHRAVDGGTHLLGGLPQRSAAVILLPPLPFRLALGEFRGGQFHVQRALHPVDLEDIAVADQPDRAADRRLRPDMADTETARGA